MTTVDKSSPAKISPPSYLLMQEEQSVPHRKQRILAVDDDPSITRLLKLNLEQTGRFVVQTENRSEHVVATARAFTPDLILLDIMMPGVSGDELAQCLRADPKTTSSRIVFLTALADRKKPYKGPDRILSKPVNIDEVLRCCREELGD